MGISKEYIVTCPLCGAVMDRRELHQIFDHTINMETGTCINVPVISSNGPARVEVFKEWTALKNNFHLN